MLHALWATNTYDTAAVTGWSAWRRRRFTGFAGAKMPCHYFVIYHDAAADAIFRHGQYGAGRRARTARRFDTCAAADIFPYSVKAGATSVLRPRRRRELAARATTGALDVTSDDAAFLDGAAAAELRLLGTMTLT